MISFPTCNEINRLISFNGKVTKAYDRSFIETAQIYSCLKCGSQTKVRCDYSQQELFLKPIVCEYCEATTFKHDVNPKRSKFHVFFGLLFIIVF